MKRLVIFSFTLLLGVGLVARAEDPKAHDSGQPAADHVQLAPADLKWMPGPPIVAPGLKMAVLMGDPGKEGIFEVRFWIPANYKIAPHWHPTTESFTVLQGEMFVGMGDTFDKSKAREVPTHGFASLPPLHPHFVYTEHETMIDLVAYGPFQLYYVNPADDPSKAAAKP